MDNNKDPKEELNNTNIPSSEEPTDSENNVNAEVSAEEDIKNDTGASESEDSKGETPKSETPKEPMGFGYYAQHLGELEREVPKKNWLFEKDAIVPENYNPYREDRSVFKEIFEENPDAFAGNAPMPEETPENYSARIHREWLFARGKAASKLKKSSNLIALAVILYLALTNGIVIALSSMTTIESFSLDTLNNIVMLLQYAFIFPAVIYVINIGQKHKTLTFFKKCEVSKLYIFKWSVISLGVTYLVALIGELFFSLIQSMGVHVNDLSTELPTDPLGLVVYFLAVVICAPIFEEILFRGPVLAQNLKHGAVFASVVSGLLFGLIHQNHEQMFYAAVLGFLFCFIDIKAGSIIPSIVAHMVVNGYSFINVFFLSFTNYNDIMYDPEAALEGPDFALAIYGLLNSIVYVFIVIAIILIIHELTTNRIHFFLSKGDNLLTGGEKAKFFLSAPATIIMLILLTISIIMNSFVDMDAIMSMLQG
ncbi:MAG: CPBP family intramembrane metalloprotease [Ruminococcaceae bacterium]|nr:CPBP family intramembrane metalloprotease [Oscillospiraceae bacterium]